MHVPFHSQILEMFSFDNTFPNQQVPTSYTWTLLTARPFYPHGASKPCIGSDSHLIFTQAKRGESKDKDWQRTVILRGSLCILTGGNPKERTVGELGRGESGITSAVTSEFVRKKGYLLKHGKVGLIQDLYR